MTAMADHAAACGPHASASPVAAGMPAVVMQPARAEVGRWEATFAGAALVGELAIVAAATLARFPLALAFAAHFAIIAGLVYAIYLRRGGDADLTAPLFTLIAVSAAGPVGALVSVAALALLRRPVLQSDLLTAWYHRISHSVTVDPQTQLSDRIASGRVMNARAPAPDALIAVVANGTLEQRQAALGLIARFFHPNYLDALAAALKSDVPVIRVQAAAVAARIRPRLAEQVASWLATATGLPANAGSGTQPRVDRDEMRRQLALLRDLDAAIRSGLLDAPLASAADRVAARLSAGLDCLRLPLERNEPVDDVARLTAFEQRLITSGEFKRLRLLRARRRLAIHGFARVRRWPGKARVPLTAEGRA